MNDLVARAWEAIGAYSVTICRGDADLAPPRELCDAMAMIDVALRDRLERAEHAERQIAFDPVAAAEQLRDAIVNDAPKLYAENQRLRALIEEVLNMRCDARGYVEQITLWHLRAMKELGRHE